MGVHSKRKLAASLCEHFRSRFDALDEHCGYLGEDGSEQILRDAANMMGHNVSVALNRILSERRQLRFQLSKV